MGHKKALVVGASVAGPALAIGLAATGWAVTVVERAPALRKGGQAVDFKGEVHAAMLGRMGVADAVRARQTGKTDARIVDARDRWPGRRRSQRSAPSATCTASRGAR
jgi:2-polyprenyl-6-methoxyphenol hydroxylase-like FAD-dependent oxidoreductase